MQSRASSRECLSASRKPTGLTSSVNTRRHVKQSKHSIELDSSGSGGSLSIRWSIGGLVEHSQSACLLDFYALGRLIIQERGEGQYEVSLGGRTFP